MAPVESVCVTGDTYARWNRFLGWVWVCQPRLALTHLQLRRTFLELHSRLQCNNLRRPTFVHLLSAVRISNRLPCPSNIHLWTTVCITRKKSTLITLTPVRHPRRNHVKSTMNGDSLAYRKDRHRGMMTMVSGLFTCASGSPIVYLYACFKCV